MQPYSPTFDFETDPAPQNLINAAALQAQLNLVAQWTVDAVEHYGVAIRDDGQLSDTIVVLRNLAPELRAYIESRVTGTVLTNALDYYFPVRAASTANVVNLQDPQVVDGVSLVSGDRVLLKNQTIAAQNGLWIVHAIGDPAPHGAGLWVRADDLLPGNPSGEGWAVCVREGTLNAQTAWAILAGASAGGAQPIVATDPLTFFPVFSEYPVPISRGGTGATTAAGARINLGAPGKFVGDITGDGIATTFPVLHGLGNRDVLVSIRDASFVQLGATITATTTTTVTLTFSTPPLIGEVLTVTVIG
jgi:hypothetical protein